MIQRLDTDNDGQISMAEIQNSQKKMFAPAIDDRRQSGADRAATQMRPQHARHA